MNLKRTLSITATAISSLFASNTSNADFRCLSVDTIDSGLGIGLTYRLYANVDPGDQVLGVFGDGDVPLYFAPNTSFYQNWAGGATSVSINPAFYPLIPSLAYDSWVTIGSEDQVDNQMLTIGIDWSDFEDNGGGIQSANGGWLVTPDDAQSYEVDGRVLIAQFTTKSLGFEFGVTTIQGRNADFTTWQHHYDSWVCWPDSDEDGVNNCCDNCYLYNPDQADCNQNGIGDVCELGSGDWNGDGIPDECQSLADIDDDGEVTVLDLLLVIWQWGQVGDPGMPGDVTWDGTVNNNDLLEVLSAWGIIYPLDLTGGCCINQTCNILSLAECLVTGGYHLGDYTNCAKDACVPDAPDCDADLNGDGYIEVNDLIELIFNWGECPEPKCYADLNRDGIININDVMYLLSLNWHVLCE